MDEAAVLKGVLHYCLQDFVLQALIPIVQDGCWWFHVFPVIGNSFTLMSTIKCPLGFIHSRESFLGSSISLPELPYQNNTD
jgi:hypothetical protein